MKTFRRIQKIAAIIGLVYGFWFGSQVDATGNDVRAGLLLVVLSILVLLSTMITDKKAEQSGQRNCYGEMK